MRRPPTWPVKSLHWGGMQLSTSLAVPCLVSNICCVELLLVQQAIQQLTESCTLPVHAAQGLKQVVAVKPPTKASIHVKDLLVAYEAELAAEQRGNTLQARAFQAFERPFWPCTEQCPAACSPL